MDDKDFDNGLKNILNDPPKFPFDEKSWEAMEKRLEATEEEEDGGAAMLWWWNPWWWFMVGLGLSILAFLWMSYQKLNDAQHTIQKLEQDIHFFTENYTLKDTVFIEKIIYQTDTIYKTNYKYKTIYKTIKEGHHNNTFLTFNKNNNAIPFSSLANNTFIHQSFKEGLQARQQTHTSAWTKRQQLNSAKNGTSFLEQNIALRAGGLAGGSTSGSGVFYSPFTPSSNNSNSTTGQSNEGQLTSIKDIPPKDITFLDLLPAEALASQLASMSIDSMQFPPAPKKKQPSPLRHLQPTGFQSGASIGYASPFGFSAGEPLGLLASINGELLFGEHLSMTFGGEYLWLKFEHKSATDWANYPILPPNDPTDNLTELYVKTAYLQIPFGMKYRRQFGKYTPHIGLGMVARRSLKENLEYKYIGIGGEYSLPNVLTPPPFQLNTIRTNLGVSYAINNWNIGLDALVDYDIKDNTGILPQLNYWSLKTGVFYDF